MLNSRQLVQQFIEGATEGIIGSKTHPGNLKIRNNQLIHFETPILERLSDGTYIFNESRYSIVTDQLQKMLLREVLPNIKYATVNRVQQDYKGSLMDYLK